MPKFRIGELIRAITDVGSGMLIEGNIYEVIDIRDSYSNRPLVRIRDSQGSLNEYYEFRFESVKPSKKIEEFM